jgi:VWFA-related protein
VAHPCVALALVALTAAPGELSPGPQQRPGAVPTFGAAVSLVRVSVVVRDKSGALVRGLTRDDFSLTEDDKPQGIDVFDFEEVETERIGPLEEPTVTTPALLKAPPQRGASPAPTASPAPVDLSGRRLVVLLFDANGMEPEQLGRAMTSARAYVDERMTAADLVAVASIGTGLQVEQDFTADRAALGRALDRVLGADTSAAAPTAEAPATDEAAEPEGFTPDASELDLFNIDRRLRAIEDLSRALAPIVQKKSVIYFSNGMSGVGADNQVELRAAIDLAVKANLSVYPVDTRGLDAVVPGGDARQASGRGTDVFSGRALTRQLDQQITSQDTLAALAGDTGGRAFLDTNDFGLVYERVAVDTSAYYLLGYTSTNPAQDGRFRRVRVRLKRPDLRIEHRSGYYAGRDFVHAGREDRERQLQEQLLSDLSSTDLPVWIQTGHFRLGENRFYVPLSVAVPGSAIPFERKGEQDRATLEVIGIVRDEAKRAVARLRDTIDVAAPGAQEIRRKNVQYRTGFALPPGKYRLKVVVRENRGGAFGSFETEIGVPDLRRSPVKLSSVVVGTQIEKAPRRELPNPLARNGTELLPSVTHVVSTKQPLYFYFEVYEPARSAAGAVRMLTSIAFFRGGQRRYETPLVEVGRLEAADRNAAVFQLSVPAASLQPGLYVCQVNVIDDVAGTFAFPRLALLVK